MEIKTTELQLDEELCTYCTLKEANEVKEKMVDKLENYIDLDVKEKELLHSMFTQSEQAVLAVDSTRKVWLREDLRHA